MKTVKIKDYYGVLQEVPVCDEVYEAYCDFHREEDRQLKKRNYHNDFVPFDSVDETIADGDRDTLIDNMIQDEEIRKLYEGIQQLTPTQRRRIYMLMSGLNYTDIAAAEGCKFAPVYRTIHAAFNHLRKLLEQ